MTNSPGWPQTCLFLLLLPECWHYRCAPLCLHHYACLVDYYYHCFLSVFLPSLPLLPPCSVCSHLSSQIATGTLRYCLCIPSNKCSRAEIFHPGSELLSKRALVPHPAPAPLSCLLPGNQRAWLPWSLPYPEKDDMPLLQSCCLSAHGVSNFLMNPIVPWNWSQEPPESPEPSSPL